MSILTTGLFVYLGWATLLFIMQRSMMFPGKNLVPTLAASQLPGGVQSIQLPFSDGFAEAWFVPAKVTSNPRQPSCSPTETPS